MAIFAALFKGMNTAIIEIAQDKIVRFYWKIK
jgi:hypothetical protein